MLDVHVEGALKKYLRVAPPVFLRNSGCITSSPIRSNKRFIMMRSISSRLFVATHVITICIRASIKSKITSQDRVTSVDSYAIDVATDEKSDSTTQERYIACLEATYQTSGVDESCYCLHKAE